MCVWELELGRNEGLERVENERTRREQIAEQGNQWSWERRRGHYRKERKEDGGREEER